MKNSDSLSAKTHELLKTNSFFPKKKLGQNFLTDPGVLGRLLEAAELSSDDNVIEIGIGLGIITKALAEKSAKLIGIEYDKILFQIAQDHLKDQNNIELIRDDILKVDLQKIIKPFSNYKVIGNLPYYISTPIISKLIELNPKPERIVLMLQKEVAERIIAKPGTKTYGSLSVFVQYHTEPGIHSYAPRSAFYPHPNVGSAIVVLKPRAKALTKNEKLFFEVVHAAFSQRRKTLGNCLKKIEGASEALKKLGIDEKRRGETLSLNEFISVSNAVSIHQNIM